MSVYGLGVADNLPISGKAKCMLHWHYIKQVQIDSGAATRIF